MRQIGAKIRELRKLRDVTQREAARRLGVSAVHLCNVERGHTQPSWRLLAKIERIWQVTVVVRLVSFETRTAVVQCLNEQHAEIERLRERALPESCCDCRFCVDQDDHIPGCDNPLIAKPRRT